MLVVAAIGIVLDQITKVIAVSRLAPGVETPAIGGFLSWTLERNPGAAFSLFTSMPWLFTILAFAISVAILFSLRKVEGTLNAVALGLVLAGAVGNLADRVFRAPAPFRGHVVDFIDLGWWPVFNIADSMVVVGAGLLVIASFIDEKKKKAAAAGE